jgi:hypothetical protein
VIVTNVDNRYVMALSNYEKQKRWREKNRALYNFQQRQRRKNLSGAEKQGIEEPAEGGLGRKTEALEGELAKASLTSNESSVCPPPAQTSKDTTLLKLRNLMRVEQEKPAVEVSVPVPARFGTYRDDGGRPITEVAWRRLQELKERAKGKYEIDDYSQA